MPHRHSHEAPWLRQLRQGARDASRAWDLLVSLNDDVGPRFTGTPGEAAGVAWALAAAGRAGLANVRTEPAECTRWERGAARADILEPTSQAIVVAALGGSVPTPAGGLEAELVVVPSLDALHQLGRAGVEGRIVYIHHLMPRLRDGTGYNHGGYLRAHATSHAARLGAVGCLVRSIATSATRAPHVGMLFYESDAPHIPAAAVCVPDGDLLARLAASGRRVRVRLELGCRSLPSGTGHNVLAEVPGTDLAHEIVLFGAHLDTWDLGRGALDDGAGCVLALETARLVSELPVRPRRTVRIALFANEELGSGGGHAYAAAHKDEAGQHFVALEADQGDGKPWALRMPEGQAQSAAARHLHSALGPLGIALDPGGARGGVDIQPLRGLGVPFFDLRQDATRYFDFHHSANDVLENVSREDLDHAVAGFAVAVAVLAHMSENLRG
ncbi:MAG: M20/M25/M40 family metallo-hydrolase [Polyangiaceae bacterium]|nr:M20/M25/M40 family metallo-hydrolase [Polyangiaceae bacterium]